MNGEDVGGSRQSVCKLSSFGQSRQFSVTLNGHFTLTVQTEDWHERVQSQAGRQECVGCNNLHKKFRWAALFLSVSDDSSSNPMSSVAILCSGITLCPQAGELDWGSKIENIASYFTCWLLIVFRVNTGDQRTWEIMIHRYDDSNNALLLSPAVELFGPGLSRFYLSFNPSALAN